MKVLMASAALLALTSAAGAYAQGAGPYYDNTIHQSAGGRDSRGFPKHYRHHHAARRHVGPGAGNIVKGEPPGPYYSNTIHQSAGGRDSRGFPKYATEGRVPSGAHAAAEPRAGTRESGPFADQERLWFKRVDQR